jgi:hypothetical protein
MLLIVATRLGSPFKVVNYSPTDTSFQSVIDDSERFGCADVAQVITTKHGCGCICKVYLWW